MRGQRDAKVCEKTICDEFHEGLPILEMTLGVSVSHAAPPESIRLNPKVNHHGRFNCRRACRFGERSHNASRLAERCNTPVTSD
jgi:hypothetical protein